MSGYIEPAGTVWIENKAVREWPKRLGTPLKLDYTELQRLFTRERKGWLLLRVARDYLLFDYIGAQGTVNATRSQLFLLAHSIWKHSINWKEFATCVRQRFE